VFIIHISNMIVRYLTYVISFMLFMSITWASSMKFFPNTWDLSMYCIYSGEIIVDIDWISTSAIDAKVFTKNIFLTWTTWLLSYGDYTFPWYWYSLKSVIYPWNTYPWWTSYLYFNRYAEHLDSLLWSWEYSLFGYLFSSTWIAYTVLCMILV